MTLEREDRDKIHGIFFNLMREVNAIQKLIPKEKEMAVNQLRFLEQEINREQPQPQVIHNSIEDFEKSFPWLKEKMQEISRHPHVRELLKEIKPNRKKRFFF